MEEKTITSAEETFLVLKYGEDYENRIVQGYFKENKQECPQFKCKDLERRVMNRFVFNVLGEK
jgi:hypothetical protein